MKSKGKIIPGKKDHIPTWEIVESFDMMKYRYYDRNNHIEIIVTEHNTIAEIKTIIRTGESCIVSKKMIIGAHHDGVEKTAVIKDAFGRMCGYFQNIIDTIHECEKHYLKDNRL